ncbi:GNAT family N-acetyltransferase [Mycetocola reblochoni]|uniref:N-acetyltransferase domain-containing protein n=2 Tax=Mycetocola reblochoni TaxID=331618 RepID=A0A1R4IJU2_9MICO|nr:GNAT family N-acetyltransferase [Mycetocola reblochoni]RLP67802.1 GNAT family N-acetyltransferase [Mycetocola reblochoni]SJN20067.1 hypothetical protein FM119_02165 [Mycetocola reblochoni REB411]
MSDAAGSDRAAELLAAYDAELRGEAETAHALRTERLGPLHLATFPGGSGFIGYAPFRLGAGESVRELVRLALAHVASDPTVSQLEWKTRGHDRIPGLESALRDNGFRAEETESIMLGQAESLAVDVPLPAGIVLLRRIDAEPDVRATSAMVDRAFGDPVSPRRADAVLDRLSRGDGTELWVAEAGGEPICAGRLEPVPGSRFAGIWGGATRADWRGRGIYRALTAARARSALAAGKTLIHSDSTAYSRPILERYGFLAVSTTTPYVWERPVAAAGHSEASTP